MAARSCFLLACVLAVGCGPKAPSVATYPVTGKVSLNGKPLEGAQVSFANKNPDGLSASGITDGEGRFKLTTYATPSDLRAGAVSGEYVVLINKQLGPMNPNSVDNEKMRSMSDAERSDFMMNRWKMATDTGTKSLKIPKSEVPAKYSNRDATPLKNITVVNGENPPFEWDLTE